MTYPTRLIKVTYKKEEVYREQKGLFTCTWEIIDPARNAKAEFTFTTGLQFLSDRQYDIAYPDGKQATVTLLQYTEDSAETDHFRHMLLSGTQSALRLVKNKVLGMTSPVTKERELGMQARILEAEDGSLVYEPEEYGINITDGDEVMATLFAEYEVAGKLFPLE